MNVEELRARQTPVKEKYKANPASALYTLRGEGKVGADISINVKTKNGIVTAGLHPGTGGDGTQACSAEMLLEALVGCAGVTLKAVATAMRIDLRDARIIAEGDVDFRGTMGVSRDVPVGFREIRLRFELDTDASDEQKAKMIELTERYCVVYQTLKNPPEIQVTH